MRRIGSFVLVVVGCAWIGAACGSDSSTGKADAISDVTVDTEPVDVTPDMGPGDVPPVEDKVTPPDVQPEQVDPGACLPACRYDDGQYCPEGAALCRTVECSYCLRNRDCPEGGICIEHLMKNGRWTTVCSTACINDGGCWDGYRCDPDKGYCVPLAACPSDPCRDGSLGHPCHYQGDANQSCGSCQVGLFCFGNKPASVACTTDVDCLREGIPRAYNPDCVGGLCGTSYCASKCNASFKCPEGFAAMAAGLGACYCVPEDVGASPAGGPCPIFNVHFEADSCGPALTCLGIAAKPDEEDPEANTCTTADDCDDWMQMLNPECVDGYCGVSFCSPKCNSTGDCEPGFGPITVSGQCFCIPTEVGDSGPGEPCPAMGVNEEADACQGGLVCLGISPGADTLECITATDCSPNWYPGGAQCVDGHCGSSFCSPKCVKKDIEGTMTDTCEAGFEPMDVSGSCYCIPVYAGNGQAGDPCPFANINGGNQNCGEDLVCLGTYPVPGGSTCATEADCPAGYAGRTQCFQGRCGSSSCALECDENGDCLSGFLPWLVGGGFCLCVGPGEFPGGRTAGQTCGFYDVNSAAGACQEGHACFGLGSTGLGETTECTADADCPLAMFPGTPKCTGGRCVTSFCAPKCDGAFDCPAGYAAIPAGDGPCFCQPIETGDAAQDDACPFGAVHPDAHHCQAGLTCLGIDAADSLVFCQQDTDCALSPYAANPTCVAGFCGTSFCAARCDGEGNCPAGWDAISVGTAPVDKCYCVPALEGLAVAQDPCPLFNVNVAAEHCQDGLVCVGTAATSETASCTAAAQCPVADYPGTADCRGGYCGSSYCAAPCDEANECPIGLVPETAGDGSCWCLIDV